MTPKPAAVSMGPTALSGRRRHAMRPHATNDTPERLCSTASSGTGGPPAVSTGIWATTPAAPAAIHSASQNHGLRVGAVNRRSPSTRGRAVSSLAPTAKGIARVIGRTDTNPAPQAVLGTAGRPRAAPARGHDDAGSPVG